MRLHVRMHAPLDPKQPYVFMANHLSTVDIWALFVARAGQGSLHRQEAAEADSDFRLGDGARGASSSSTGRTRPRARRSID